MEKTLISIIVPTLNEEDNIFSFYQHLLHQEPPWELLVVDSNSQDKTKKIIQEQSFVRVFNSKLGRGTQMNLGASEAKGKIYLFLHVDLKLPATGLAEIRKAIAAGYCGGGFFKRFEPSHFLLLLNQFLLNWIRGQLFSSMVGTNGIFCKADIFKELDGFREWPFLEDVDFSDRLKRKGKIKLIRSPICVSARKYKKDGVFKRTLNNIYILFLYRVLKRSPEELILYYQSKKDS